MNQEPIKITCRKCKKTFPFKCIIQHATKSSCNYYYSQDHLLSLREHSEYIRKSKLAARYQLNKGKIREQYQEEKIINKTRILKGDTNNFGPSTSNPKQDAKEEKEKINVDLLDICKSCKIEFGDTSILRHLKDPLCRKDYDEEELEYIRGWSEKRKDIVFSDYYERNKEEIKSKNKEYWAKNKASIMNQRKEYSEKKRNARTQLLERCKSCNKKLGEAKILAHIGQKASCKQNYSEDELAYINEKVKERKNLKDSEYYQTHTASIAARKSKAYRKKRDEKKRNFVRNVLKVALEVLKK